MRFQTKTVIYRQIALVCVFFLCSGSMGRALAQSDEYRRGYDRGYRDGAYSARNGAGDRGNWHRRGGLEIESASYGSHGRRCDLRDSLRAQWRNDPVMTIKVDNRLCGDPAPGERKQLIVHYRCHGGPVQQENVREGRVMNLNCY